MRRYLMNDRILFVDDDLNILSGYMRNLRTKFSVTTQKSGREALEFLRSSEPFAVVVSDYKMPSMDGITFLSLVKDISPDTIRIMLTGYADVDNAINAVNHGNVFRFLTKPAANDLLINTLNTAVEQYRLVTSERELLDKTLKGSIKVLIDILAAVNPVAFSRASRISMLSKKVAERLKMEKIWEVELAVLLSQIGCVTIPQEVLDKKISGRPLTPEENTLFLSHPQIGSNLLRNIPRLEEISDAIACQLKRFDGSGDDSENKKKGKSIPVLARIIKVVTDFDTHLESGKSNVQAIFQMNKDEGRYDPDILIMLESEISGIEKGFVMKHLYIKDIVPGMIVSENILDANGLTLVTKGTEMTDIFKFRLENISRIKKIIEPIKFLVPSKQAMQF
jgi:response regulator RpfG family c-di-GMP phosphodiesterase